MSSATIHFVRSPTARALLALVLLGTVAVISTSAQDRASGFAGDFETLVELVEETHPDPYAAFGGRDAYHRVAAQFKQRADAVESAAELHALLQRFLAHIGDGHTAMSSLSGELQRFDGWSPMVADIAADGMFIGAATSDLSAYVGSRILALNGVPLSGVLDSVRTAYPVENRYGAMHRLQRLLIVKTAAWPPVLRSEAPLRVTVRTPGGDTETLDLPFTRERPQLVPPAAGLDVSGDNGLLYGKILDHGGVDVGYFAWNAIVSREVADAAYANDPDGAAGTFDWVFNYLPDAQRTGDLEKDLELMPSLYGRFSRLLEELESRDVGYLVLDLRRNDGGMTPLVYPLLFMLYGDDVVRSDIAPRYDVRVSQLFLAQRGLNDIAAYNERYGTDLALGEIRHGYLFRNDFSLPAGERGNAARMTFNGYGAEYLEPAARAEVDPRRPRVVVLTSTSTFSAAFHFMYYLAEIGDAVTVGTPPRQAPNAFMEATRFTLPSSGLSGTIANAVQRLYPDDDPRATVYTPDYPMSWDDFRRYGFGPNAEVRFALDLIAGGRIAQR